MLGISNLCDQPPCRGVAIVSKRLPREKRETMTITEFKGALRVAIAKVEPILYGRNRRDDLSSDHLVFGYV